MPAPLESVDGARVEVGHVIVNGDRLRTFFTFPAEGTGPVPVVLLLSGLGTSSVELPADDRDARRKLVEGLTAMGIGTMRVERSGRRRSHLTG